MNDREHAVQDILAGALELEDGPLRAQFIAQGCGADAALRQEVEELVRASILAGRFLPEEPGTNGLPAAPAGTTKTASSALALPAAPGPEKAGDRIGRYRLLQ